MRTIAHLSDLHFGRADPRVADALVADLAANPVDLVVVSGDFTQRARRRQYVAARRFLDRLPRPQVLVPGNHDIPLYDLVRRFVWPLNRYRRYISDDLWPFYADEQIAVLGMNSARSWSWRWNGFWKDGRLSDEQLRKAAALLAEVAGDALKIVVVHHPFIAPARHHVHNIIGNVGPALATLGECGVDILLGGHLHQPYHGDVRAQHPQAGRSILSIQAGTAISARRRGQLNSYNVLRVEGSRLDLCVRAWDGAAFAPAATTGYLRGPEGWHQVDCEGNASSAAAIAC
jgi:3',5'-cyclic AMP phosphodiesterase CpdA